MFDGTANPTPSLPPTSLWICDVMPITLPLEVEQRAARVAVVDRGVGLDRAFDRRVFGSRDLAVDRADDAARDGAVEPERVADRDDAVTDLRRSLESASVSGVSFEEGALTCRTAMSVEVSDPTTVAL